MLNTTIYSVAIVYWLGMAVIQTKAETETNYSKFVVWLAFITVTGLSLGNML